MLTRVDDPTADMVIAELNRRDIPVVRLDPGVDFPGQASTSAYFGTTGMIGEIATGSRRLDLQRVRAVYYRRPTPYGPEKGGLDSAAEFAAREARFGLGGILAGINCPYVNHPWQIARAEVKPLQLLAAVRAGFTVPATLITNRPDKARAFADSYERVVYKPLRSIVHVNDRQQRSTIWTGTVDSSEMDESIKATAHLFQVQVDKVADLRITAVGSRLFCVRIDSPSLDWREDYDAIVYSVVDPPHGLELACDFYLKHFGLRFGCFDFALGKEGEPIFLECNPNGQWAWLEDATGVPIASAIADLLEGSRL
ncbi:ATP-grasp ribosomal peptide maturase [Thermopolyspora sp. NPDC052614]|uniref:ATP-grasp ribosomal peptide maturase n=1 Tax=Thermopolyspora sp. NPDC052614 TaxID=3155682 RepID=UPI00342AABD6